MATKKRDPLIEYELEFLEQQLEELKTYIETHPFGALADRKDTKGKVVASKEIQRKDITQAIKDYADILRTVRDFREKKETQQSSVRGDQALTPIEAGEL